MAEGPMQSDMGSPGELWAECRYRLPGATEQQVCAGGVSAEHGRLLWVWQCQRLHMLTGQVTVAVGTVTFEFPGICMEFQLHNTTTTWIFPPSCPPSWHLIFFFFLIPVNEIHSSLPVLFLGADSLSHFSSLVSLTFLLLLPQNARQENSQGPSMWKSSSCVQARTLAWGEPAWSCLWDGPLYVSRWAQLSCVLISPKGTLPVSASALLFILLCVHGASLPGGLVKFFPDFSFYLETYPFWEMFHHHSLKLFPLPVNISFGI